MSKKSRRRNKKILAALALAGGAAMLGRGKGPVTGVVNPNLSKASVAADVAKDVAKDVVSPGSNFQTRFKSKVGNKWRGPGEITGIANRVTDVEHPILTQSRVPPGAMRGFHKGGGIAKRGMGAAFKKGGHVKSMGIAKRGGGAAKR